ncbi:ATP-dependent RNA helicase DDX24 [Asbolus verrucosus]|uniref:ATP-dependent RNA helicase n=1 Tax=Asbolus verrucosus TaxID=1661398 RepID=A0A482W424_ASBVE|nr:ATP-dependent RNA helicase DDX24 [Asbolus verrucosus]
MVENQVKINWKSLTFDDPDLTSRGLVAVEECTDYNLIGDLKTTHAKPPKGRRDIIGAAETGSGKTLAFGLPILTGIYNEKSMIFDDVPAQAGSRKPLYALILTPTRELAIQVKNHLTAAAKFLDVNIAVLVGGMAAVKQERILSKGPEIVVATPGRLWELIQQGNSHLSQINNIKFLVIDETDRMLERGHFEELQDLLERLNLDESKKKTRQNFVFSATLTLVHDLPKYLKTKMKKSEMTSQRKLQKIIDVLGVTDPKIVDVTQGGGTSKTLTESRITCGIEEKDHYIYYFLRKYPGRTLIFCNSIGCVRRLTNLLGILECRPLPLHAAMQQKQRLKNLERFRDNEGGILVATDVAARGLDIPKVDHVIHYQTPRTSESYVHRSGRTARASQQGITILLIEPSEMQNYIKLCKTLSKSSIVNSCFRKFCNCPIPGEDLPVFPVDDSYLKAVKERVNLARELDKLELEVRKGNSEVGWLQKTAEEMDIIVDDLYPLCCCLFSYCCIEFFNNNQHFKI